MTSDTYENHCVNNMVMGKLDHILYTSISFEILTLFLPHSKNNAFNSIQVSFM